MELAEGGAIDVVLAKKRNRLLRSRLYRLLWDQDLAELVEPGVASRLDRGAVYGLWTWNTRKTTRRKVWDETAGEFKTRYNYAPRPGTAPTGNTYAPRRSRGRCGGSCAAYCGTPSE